MKKVLLLVTMWVVAIAAMAVPANPKWRTVTQPDGTVIEIRQVGDEFYHYIVNREGKCVSLNDKGFYEVVGEAPSSEVARARRAKAMASKPRKAVGVTPNLAPKGIVILANFKDKAMASSHTQAVFDELCNSTNCTVNTYSGTKYPSAAEYFNSQSNGQYRPQFDVFGPVTLSKELNYYGQNDNSDDPSDMYATDAVVEACILANQQYSNLNFANYDSDGDGYVDFVYVIYAGQGEADGGAENTIWPHNWEIESAIYYGNCTYTSSQCKIDGKKLNNYACSAELSGSSLSGIGTLCHEFGHVMGLPDFYDTNYGTNSKSKLTPNEWDIMDGGSYNGDGHCPPNYDPWEKYFFGWVTPVNLGSVGANGTLNANGADNYNVYQINASGSLQTATTSGLNYYLENRQQTGWDKFIPSHGMVIWKVDFDATAWTNNEPNNTANSPKFTIVCSSGTKIGEGYGSNNVFGGASSIETWNGVSDKPLTEITESNKIITFKFMGGAVEVPEGKVLLTYDLEGVTKISGPDAGTIDEGEAFTATFTATNGYYDIDSEHCHAEVTVGGNEVANAYTIAGGKLTVSLTAAQVTGPVVVTIYNTDKNPAKTDVLNYNFVGVTGTSYSAWTAKDGSKSDAVYAGNTAGGNSSIQLRSNNNNSGIVSTTSGGKLKSITVKFNSATSNGRVLDVYASNTPYTAATDLYSSSTQGTKVTSFTYNSAASSPARRAVAADDGLTYTFEDDYEYIGIRSNSGALYLDEVDIAWRVAAENPSAEADITFSPDAIEFTETLSSGVAQADKTLSVTGVNLADVILVDISSTSDVFSIDTDELASEGGKVVVTLNASAAGSYSAEITLLSVDANNNNVERKVQVSATVSEEGGDTPTYTVTWSVDGVETEEQVEETLSHTKAAPANCENGRVFMGWTSQSSVSGEAPSDLFDATEGIAVNGDATYYAVFATASESQGGAGTSTTITIEDYASADGTFGDFIFTAGGSGTKAAYNTNGKDARYYAGNTLTIESATAMTSIVFNISTQGLKRLAPITADAGEIATQASGDATVTWTGSATSVTFTVGAHAEYGSDGSSKAGQLDFISVDITAAGSGSATTYSDYSLECEVAVEAPKTYVVAGNIEELGKWDLDSAPEMTVNGATATYVISDLVLTAGTNIEYKVVIRQEGQADVWKGDAQNNDANYSIYLEDAGTYTLTFTYNIEDETAACAVERTDFADYTFNLVERPSDWTDTPKLFVWDDQNNSQNGEWPGAAMTADGNIYTATVRVYGTQANIIFSNNGTPQTCDISDAKSGNYRVNSTVCENSEHLSADLVYKVNVSDYEGGSVIVNSWAAEGEEVQVEAYADNGYTLEELTVTYADNSSDVITSSFTMPAGDVTINATFVKDAVEVTVQWLDEGSNFYTETLNAGTPLGDPGEPAACESGKVFVGWTENVTLDGSKPADLFTFTDGMLAPEEDAVYNAVFANATQSSGGSASSIEITASSEGVPSTYGSGYSECTLEGFTFQVQQMYNNGGKMQWRAAGNSNGTGTMYNTDAFSGGITSIVLTYNSGDSNKNFTINVGSSENPTDGTSIEATEVDGTYVFDCSSANAEYFVITNGSGAGYLDKIVVNYGSGNSTTYSDYSLECGEPAQTCTPIGINLDYSAAKVEYTIGEQFSTDGLVVELVYVEQECASEVVTGWTVSQAPDMTAENVYSVEISYTVGEETFTETYDVAVYAPTTYTVTWSVDGTETTAEFNEGAALTLPAAPAACESGKVFVGWTAESQISGAPADLFTEAGNLTVTEDITYYAVFANATQSQGGSADEVNVSLTEFAEVAADMDNYISYEAARGAASTNPAVNSGQIRIYQNGGTLTVSAKDGATITDITIGSAMNTSVTYSLDGGQTSADQAITANGVLTLSDISASSILFTCTGTDKNSRLYLNNLSVTYSIGEGSGNSTTYSDYSLECGEAPVPAASIVADPASVSFEVELVGGVVDGAQQTVTITAENLNTTYNEINVSLKEGSDDEFTVSPATLDIAGGDITITLDAIAAGNYEATIVVESLDADENVVSIEIPVNATVTDPTVVPETYNVTVVPTDNGTVAANPTEAAEGETITLTVTPNEGYQLASLSVVDAANSTEIEVATDNTFVMPAANVTVTATFELIPVSTEATATFIFNTDTGLEALGIAKPGTSAGTELGTEVYSSNSINLSATSGSTPTRVWNSNGTLDLRVYKNATLTFSGATITKIELAGSAVNVFTAETGTFTSGTWEGEASEVVLTATGTAKINTITVTYSGSVTPAVKYYLAADASLVGDANAWQPNVVEMVNGTITISDVAAGEHKFKVTDGQWNSEIETDHEFTITDADCTTADVSYDSDGNICFITYKVQDVVISIVNGKVCVKADTEKPYYLAASASLVGDANAWQSNVVEMVNGTITLNNIAAGTHAFKVTDGAWNGGLETDHEFNVWNDECSNVTLTHDDNGNISFSTNEEQNITISIVNKEICVEVADIPVTLNAHYVKVSEALSDWSGDYLIVYEEGALAFNGGLDDITIAQNGLSVEIKETESKKSIKYIQANDATVAAEFSIAIYNNGYTIQNKSALYIGQTTDANGIKAQAAELENSISYNSTDECIDIIASGGAYLRYNATSGQERFRYYKSSTYSAQKPVQLYKKADGETPTEVENNAHTEVMISITGNTLVNMTGHEVGIFSVTGQRMATIVESFDISTLPAGMYVVSDGKNTLKLFTR